MRLNLLLLKGRYLLQLGETEVAIVVNRHSRRPIVRIYLHRPVFLGAQRRGRSGVISHPHGGDGDIQRRRTGPASQP